MQAFETIWAGFVTGKSDIDKMIKESCLEGVNFVEFFGENKKVFQKLMKEYQNRYFKVHISTIIHDILDNSRVYSLKISW